MVEGTKLLLSQDTVSQLCCRQKKRQVGSAVSTSCPMKASWDQGRGNLATSSLWHIRYSPSLTPSSCLGKIQIGWLTASSRGALAMANRLMLKVFQNYSIVIFAGSSVLEPCISIYKSLSIPQQAEETSFIPQIIDPDHPSQCPFPVIIIGSQHQAGLFSYPCPPIECSLIQKKGRHSSRNVARLSNQIIYGDMP